PRRTHSVPTRRSSDLVCDRASGGDTSAVFGIRRAKGVQPAGILERGGLGLARERERGASGVLETRGSGTLAAPEFRPVGAARSRSEEHTSELQSRSDL